MVAIAVAGVAAAMGCARDTNTEQHVADGDEHAQAESRSDSSFTGVLTSGGVYITHMHGIGFSSDGSRLFAAAHDGLKVFESGSWTSADAPHDFMGFSPVEGGFISSGHPNPTSGLQNPFGVIRVDERDFTVVPLAFYGLLDLHLMAAGYSSGAVYVVNAEQTDALGTGLFVSVDGGAGWEQKAASGIDGGLRQMAAHPTDPLTSAYVTTDGLYLSHDGGSSLERVVAREGITATTFSPDGDRLFFGGAALEYWSPTGQTQRVGFNRPDEVIAFIAANPAHAGTMAVATTSMNIYLSNDDGETWRPVLVAGRSL